MNRLTEKIELLTHAPALVPTIQQSDNSWTVGICHDALAAHAYDAACHALAEHTADADEIREWIEYRAAEILADYLKVQP